MIAYSLGIIFLQRKSIILALYTLPLSIILTGCLQGPIAFRPKGLSEASTKPLYLKVSSVEIQNHYLPKRKIPYVEHLFREPPTILLEQWANDRFIAIGNTHDRAILTILDAHVTEERVSGEAGDFLSLFPTQQAEVYQGRICVKLEVLDQQGRSKGYIKASSVAKRHVSSHTPLGIRYQIWSELSQELINALNREIEKNIYNVLSAFITNN